ncbi:MAG: hypothetical protein LAN63_08795 [Acidobacteriia bacterium]|nr:hypothetical protein [Terriglobia bacterium]
MESYKTYQIPTHWAIEHLEDVSARAGLGADDVAHLLDSGLDVDHLLEYLQAMLSDRMN